MISNKRILVTGGSGLLVRAILAAPRSSRLIALYTAAFALGQILGPPTVSLFHGGLAAPSVLAAFVLVASSLALGRGASAPETSE